MARNGETLLTDLRSLEPEAHTACLYLGEDLRHDAATLYLFDAEIARIPALISEPMPGEIRLQFWRDLVAGRSGSGAGPLGDALLSIIEKHNLPREVFHNYLNARIFDLYNDPMPDMGTLEGYLGETRSVLFQMVALCGGIDRSKELADACGHAGVALGLAKMLANLARHRNEQKIYVPSTMLASHGLSADDWLKAAPEESHRAVVKELVDLSRDYLMQARNGAEGLPAEARPIFLPLAFVAPILKQVEQRGASIFESPVILSPLKRQWAAFTWALKH